MPSFLLSKKALEDLKSIGRYTQINWGREQRTITDPFHELFR